MPSFLRCLTTGLFPIPPAQLKILSEQPPEHIRPITATPAAPSYSDTLPLDTNSNTATAAASLIAGPAAQVPKLYEYIFSEHNRHRVEHGVAPLAWDAELAGAADNMTGGCDTMKAWDWNRGECCATVLELVLPTACMFCRAAPAVTTGKRLCSGRARAAALPHQQAFPHRKLCTQRGLQNNRRPHLHHT